MNKDNVVGFPENQAIKYNFDFLISVHAGEASTSLTPPCQFQGMSSDDVLMITQLSLSMFESTPVYSRSQNREGGVNFVPESFSNETLRLVLNYSPIDGYDLHVDLPKSLERVVGQEMIAKALHVEFEKFEQILLSAQNNSDTEEEKLKISGIAG